METKREPIEPEFVPDDDFRCHRCGSKVALRFSDAEGTIPWLCCDVCKKYGGRPKGFWCPECGSQDFLDYTELGKSDNGLLYCSACHKTLMPEECREQPRPRPWRWRYWKATAFRRCFVVAGGLAVYTTVVFHVSVTSGTARELFGDDIGTTIVGTTIVMGIAFFIPFLLILDATFNSHHDRR